METEDEDLSSWEDEGQLPANGHKQLSLLEVTKSSLTFHRNAICVVAAFAVCYRPGERLEAIFLYLGWLPTSSLPYEWCLPFMGTYISYRLPIIVIKLHKVSPSWK